jgi:hypothetical protein
MVAAVETTMPPTNTFELVAEYTAANVQPILRSATFW